MTHPDQPRAENEPRPTLLNRLARGLLVAAVAVGGAQILAQAVSVLPQAVHGDWTRVLALAVLTVLTGTFNTKAPGQPATVSVSDFFVFVLILTFGPAPAVLTAAACGFWMSLIRDRPTWHRAVFNITAPAIGVWAGGMVYADVIGPDAAALAAGGPKSFVAVLAMTLTCFLTNSTMAALMQGFESGVSVFGLWRRHSLYLAVHYYLAAALAMLAIESDMRLAVAALVAPLLVLPYVAHRAIANRMEEAQQHTDEVQRLYEATVETLAIAVDAKDHITHGHVRRVQRHTMALARALGITNPMELKAIEAASLLHDVGKLSVPDYILNKPGALLRSEFELIKGHVNAGAAMLRAVDFPFPVVPIVRGHHEQWDGRGYPDGLAGDAIPIGARILSVVDCFDALTSDRPYRRRLSDDEALEVVRTRSGTMYDPRVVEAFVSLIPRLREEDVRMEEAAPIEEVPPSNDSLGDGRAVPDDRRPPELRLVAPDALNSLKRQLPDAEACLLVVQPGTERLSSAHATSLLRGALEVCTLQRGQGVSGWVAAHRYRIVNADPALDLGEMAALLNLKSCMSVPVFSIGDLIGVLTVYLPQPRGFGEREVQIVGVLAQEIGLDAIHTVGLPVPGLSVLGRTVHSPRRAALHN